MHIDWLRFSAALLLLLTPVALFHGRNVRYRPLQRQWGDEQWRQVAGLAWHTIDLLRAALGTWLLMEALAKLPEARGIMRHGPLLTQCAVLWLAVTLQSLVCREPDSLNAPFTFVTGAVFVYFFPTIASFSLVLAWLVPMATRSSAAFFPTLAVVLPALGFLLAGKSKMMELGIAAVAALLPFLLSLLFNRQFVIAYRPRRTSDTSSPLKSTEMLERSKQR